MAICATCGAWTEPPIVERQGEAGCVTVCPRCGSRERLVQHPLWWIGGSPGTGKTTLVPLLRALLPDCVVFEGEAIDFWRFEGAPDTYSSLYNQWLKVAWEIALNAYPVVFLGIATPAQLDACTLRMRFSALHYMGLVCSAEEQARRLRARPAWRNSASPDFVAQACGFTSHLYDAARRGAPPIVLCDTGTSTPEEISHSIAAWVRASIAAAP